MLLTLTMDQMDVDSDIHTTSSLPLSSSFEAKLLKELDLIALNDCMKTTCEDEVWQYHINLGTGSTRAIIRDVLEKLLKELAANMRISFVSPLEAKTIANSLDDDELKQWKAMVRDGVEKDDWSALIVHRTYIWIIPTGGSL